MREPTANPWHTEHQSTNITIEPARTAAVIILVTTTTPTSPVFTTQYTVSPNSLT